MRSSLALLLLFFAILLPGRAEAIPTPDTLATGTSLLFQIIAAVATALTSLYIYISRRARKSRSFGLWISGFLMLLTFATVASAILFYRRASWEKEIAKLYFRSDLNLDQKELDAASQQFDWYAKGIIKGTVSRADMLLLPPETLFIDPNRSSLGYSAGTLVFRNSNGLNLFEHWWPQETESKLKEILEARADGILPALVFSSARPFVRDWNLALSDRLVGLLQHSKGVYIVSPEETQANDPIMYWANPLEPDKAILQDSTSLSFPLRPEEWAYNQSLVRFQNASTILPPEECLELIRDPRVQLIVPTDSSYRSVKLVEYYLSRYLTPDWELNRKDLRRRVHIIDFNQAAIADDLDATATQNAGKSFLVLGVTKHDWIYNGLSVAWAVMQKDRSSNYLGGCPWLSEIGAIASTEQKSQLLTDEPTVFSAVSEVCKTISFSIWHYLEKVHSSTSQPKIFIVFVFGLLFRFCFFSIAKREKRKSDLEKLLRRLMEKSRYIWLKDVGYRNLLYRCFDVGTRTVTAGFVLSLVCSIPCLSASKFFLETRAQTLPAAIFCLLLMLISLNPGAQRMKRQDLRRYALSMGAILLSFFLVSATFAEGVVYFLNGALLAQLAMLTFSSRRSKLQAFLRWHPADSSKGFAKSNKASRLVAIQAHSFLALTKRVGGTKLFQVAPIVVVDQSSSIPQLAAGSYIVRSCLSSEDTRFVSKAGQGTSVVVSQTEMIPQTVQELLNSPYSPPEILIQPYVKTDLAGVLFTKSPSNAGVMQIDFSTSPCSEVVSGQCKTDSSHVGRFSGQILEQHENAIPTELRKRLFLLGWLLERYFKYPQDIEWGYRSDDDALFVFQSRDITAFVDKAVVTEHQRRQLLPMIHLHTSLPKLILNQQIAKVSSLEEQLNGCCRLSRSLFASIMSRNSALGEAWKHIFGKQSTAPFTVYAYDLLLEVAAAPGSRLCRYKFPQLLKNIHQDSESFCATADPGIATSDQLAATRLIEKLSIFSEQFYVKVLIVNLLHSYFNSKGLGGFKARESFSSLLQDFPKKGENYFRRAEDPTFVQAYDFAQDFRPKWKCMAPPPSLNDWEIVREIAKSYAIDCICDLRQLLQHFCLQLEIDFNKALSIEYSAFLRFLKAISTGSLERNQAFARAEWESMQATLESGFPYGSLIECEHLLKEDAIGLAPATSKLKMIGAKKGFSGMVLKLEGPSQLKYNGSKPIIYVKHLFPEYYQLFPHIAGMVSQNGSELSHLAILARESNIPIALGPLNFLIETAGETNIEVSPEGLVIWRANLPNGVL